MLTPLQPSASRRATDDLVELLLDCHRRIRNFVSTARHLADAEAVTDSEAREAALATARYFTLALPLHVRDEEESIVPRLAGRDAEIDAALRDMSRQHLDHLPPLARLVELLQDIAAAPGERLSVRSELTAVVAELDHAFTEHLASEEQVILPAIRRLLDADEQRAVIAELRARRDAS